MNALDSRLSACMSEAPQLRTPLIVDHEAALLRLCLLCGAHMDAAYVPLEGRRALAADDLFEAVKKTAERGGYSAQTTGDGAVLYNGILFRPDIDGILPDDGAGLFYHESGLMESVTGPAVFLGMRPH